MNSCEKNLPFLKKNVEIRHFCGLLDKIYGALSPRVFIHNYIQNRRR